MVLAEFDGLFAKGAARAHMRISTTFNELEGLVLQTPKAHLGARLTVLGSLC
jgi:hypothetical protein